MKSILFIFFFSICSYSFSQYKVSGKVIEQKTKKGIEAATIYAEPIEGNDLIAYTITNQDGVFEFDIDTKLKKINLIISSNGYQTYKKLLDLNKKEFDLSVVEMKEKVVELSSVDVIGERPPISIKKDTLEFNADSFKTRPDANIEELLKKLPGVEIDNDGRITVNGKEVNQILVNGKPFFSNDPKIATKNLPKEIIDKIQVTDTKTETEKFTGKNSNSEEKTINLTIKKDKNKGLFGRVTAGYGTDERYELSGIVNYFNDDERFSILSSSNNINSPGFSFDEIFDAVGRQAASISVSRGGAFSIGNLSFGGGQGITTSTTAGGNYANDFANDKVKTNGDYFYANSNSFNDTRTFRENILPDNRFFTNSTANSDANSNSHRISSKFQFEIDSTLRVVFNPTLNILDVNSNNIESTISEDENGNTINRSNTENRSNTNQYNFGNELSVIKKFGKKGNYIKLGLDTRLINNTGETFFNSSNEIFGTNPSVIAVEQFTDTDNETTNWEADIEYRQPLKDKLFLDIGYAFNINEEDNERLVFDFDNTTNDFTLFNDQLSSDFQFTTTQQRPSLQLNYEGKKLNLGVKGSFIHTELDNEDAIQNVAFNRDFNDVLFGVNLRYQPKRGTTIRVNYDASVVIPEVSQLQPVENITNPLNIITGNPDLEPTINHRIDLSLNNFDWKKRTGIFTFGSITLQEDRVVANTITDENLLRRTTYDNINGNYNIFLTANYSKRIKKDSLYTLNVRYGITNRFNNIVNFNNGVELTTKQLSIRPNVRLTYNYKEKLEIAPSYTLAFNNTTYSLDTFDDIDFIEHDLQLKTTTYWPKNLVWGNDVIYTFNGSIDASFQRSAVFWNMSLGLKMMKEKGLLKVLAYDLLNQNINTRRTTSQDFIQDTQGTVLQRYFLLSFTYKFDKFGTKNKRGSGISF
ncbi:TonB-dependent receptor [Flavobacteriaceae bacterium R38]|nr:TonB-dependent receptor [Flavobacteriaceae bacterium R38]